jgi:RNA polymerase sigma-70 factor (ECF subfamily)
MRELREKEKSAELSNKILSMIKNGSKAENEAGFELLFKKFKPMVFNFFNKALFSDGETAKDLMIEVFMKVHINIDSYSSEKAALSTWIHRISKNVLIDHLRSRANKDTLSIDSLFENNASKGDDDNSSRFQIADENISNDSSELLIREERVLELLNALNKLEREEHRKVLTLYYFEEKSYKEISAEMNMLNNSVKVLLHRAKISLRNILDKQGFKA